MGFMTLVKKVKKQNRMLKILIMGLDNAGKSTILKKYLKINTETAPTFGYQIYNCEYKGFEICIVDIGGQRAFKPFWNNYFENIDGIIYVIDVTDNRKTYLNEIVEMSNGVPIAIFANKIDLICNFEEFNNCNNKVFKTSAVKDLGIEEGFEWIFKTISE